jgi:hypothetical protein
MSKAEQVKYVYSVLDKLLDIDQQINMLDSEVDRERIALLREESLRIQLTADKELETI